MRSAQVRTQLLGFAPKSFLTDKNALEMMMMGRSVTLTVTVTVVMHWSKWKPCCGLMGRALIGGSIKGHVVSFVVTVSF